MPMPRILASLPWHEWNSLHEDPFVNALAGHRRLNGLTLRVRQKMQTRQEIADAAKTLFAARGWSDEDTTFDARLVDKIRGRPVRTKVADAVRAGAHAFLREAAAQPKGPKSRGDRALCECHRPGFDRGERRQAAPLAAKSLGFSIAAIFAATIDEIGQGTRQANMGAWSKHFEHREM